MSGDAGARDKLRALRADLPLYARTCLRILTKTGALAPFVLNPVQLRLHAALEAQRREKGRVRALFLKARQQGGSTYIAGRFYHRTSMRRGVNCFIMAHEQSASDNLFGIVNRFHTHNPLRPQTAAANKKELVFDRLDSSYIVGTAGQKAGGRSRTFTLFHGSEAALWSNAPDHFAASVQAVPDLPETEIILESTAMGASGEFYERWQDAQAGRGDYIAFFSPWFHTEEYRRHDLVTEDFSLSDEREDDAMSEADYAAAYGLDHAQMAWRRAKLAELRSVRLFQQEYPATAAEAFVAASDDSFISGALVLRARKRQQAGAGPLIMGADPAGVGGDRFAVAFRRGLVVERVLWRDRISTADAHQWLRALIAEHKPEAAFIDAGGVGAATVSLLKTDSPEIAGVVRGVNFGGASEAKRANPRKPGPRNRRAEMWARMKEWLEAEEGAVLPDMDVLQSDLTAPRAKPSVTGDFGLESKQEMRSRGVRSPDLADAVALTFATLRVTTKTSGAEPAAAAQDFAPAAAGAYDWMSR